MAILAPPFAPALCAAGPGPGPLLAPRAGEAIDAQRCGSRCPASDALHLQRKGISPAPMQDKHWLGSRLGSTWTPPPPSLHIAMSKHQCLDPNGYPNRATTNSPSKSYTPHASVTYTLHGMCSKVATLFWGPIHPSRVTLQYRRFVDSRKTPLTLPCD